MRFQSPVLLLVACLVAFPAAAQTVDLNLSDDVVEAQFRNSLGLGASFDRAEYELGFLYKDSKRNSTMGDVGFEVSGPVAPNAPGFDVGAGVKGYLASVADWDVGSITLGLMARYAFPSLERVALTGRVNYGPRITTFNDGKDFLYTTARLSYEILSDVEIYTGYRDINVSLKNNRGDLNVDEGWFVGLDMKLR